MNLASPTLPPAVPRTPAVATRAARALAGAGTMRRGATFTRSDARTDRAADGRRGRHLDLEPFWPSRQPHLFDQTCPGSPSASRHSLR